MLHTYFAGITVFRVPKQKAEFGRFSSIGRPKWSWHEIEALFTVSNNLQMHIVSLVTPSLSLCSSCLLICLNGDIHTTEFRALFLKLVNRPSSSISISNGNWWCVSPRMTWRNRRWKECWEISAVKRSSVKLTRFRRKRRE